MMEQALVNEAQSNINRARPLVASRAITQGEYDTLVAQFKAAQARYNSALNLVGEQISMIGVRRKELALAQQTVVDSRIVAPFDGVVGERRVSPGEYRAGGAGRGDARSRRSAAIHGRRARKPRRGRSSWAARRD